MYLDFIAADNSGEGRKVKSHRDFADAKPQSKEVKERSLLATLTDYATGVGLQISPSPPLKSTIVILWTLIFFIKYKRVPFQHSFFIISCVFGIICHSSSGL